MQFLQKIVWIKLCLLTSVFLVYGQQQWQSKTPMPTERQGMAAAVLDDNIYVMGGSQSEYNALNVVEVYDAQQDSWQTNIASLNVARINAAAVALQGKIYLFGGRDHNQLISQVEMYDPILNQWSTVSQLPTLREGLAAVVVDSLIWVIGGAAFPSNYDIVEIYDPHTNSWDTLPHHLNTPRVASVAAVIDDEVYVFGGFYFGPLNSYEKYIPGQGWNTAGNMLYACGSAAGDVLNGQIWLVGGENQSGFLAKVQYADISGPGTWTNGPLMQTQRKSLSVARVGNRLFAIGGKSGHHMGDVTGAVESLDLLTGILAIPGESLSENLNLSQNFPNPFNGNTSFDVYLKTPAEVRIAILNLLGQTVRIIYRGRISGWRRFEFDGRDDFGRSLPSGNYFIYLMASEEKRVIKATILK